MRSRSDIRQRHVKVCRTGDRLVLDGKRSRWDIRDVSLGSSREAGGSKARLCKGKEGWMCCDGLVSSRTRPLICSQESNCLYRFGGL